MLRLSPMLGAASSLDRLPPLLVPSKKSITISLSIKNTSYTDQKLQLKIIRYKIKNQCSSLLSVTLWVFQMLYQGLEAWMGQHQEVHLQTSNQGVEASEM